MTDLSLAAPSLGRPVAEAPAPPAVLHHPVGFTGQAGEYFRIWIVNIALTLVTFGLYMPWARIRTKQYFYGHTWVDGQNFEYRANPWALLRGYLLIGGLSLLASLAFQSPDPTYLMLGILLMLVYLGFYPWLVRQSLRFQAVNTVHRGLNFSFHGSVGQAYVAYGAANLAASLVSFALPWAWFMQRRYQLDHLAYGTARAQFRGDVAPFYLIAVTGLALVLGSAAVMFGLWLAFFGGSALLELFSAKEQSEAAVMATVLMLLVPALVTYVVVLLVYSVAWQYVRAAIMAYVLNHTELGGVVRTGASFSPWRVVWIGVTNSLAQLLTLGLATPWAAIRRTRYIMGGLQVRSLVPLDTFTGQASHGESALGEAASELLDIQVGF
ncbi:YjgN family protein [Deinococcus arcticus]|nr:YjgN family protein [Deinococcus arcticus]